MLFFYAFWYVSLVLVPSSTVIGKHHPLPNYSASYSRLHNWVNFDQKFSEFHKGVSDKKSCIVGMEVVFWVPEKGVRNGGGRGLS